MSEKDDKLLIEIVDDNFHLSRSYDDCRDEKSALIIPRVRAECLHKELSLEKEFIVSSSSEKKSLDSLKMEDDDAPILRYIFRNLNPDRHLEIGTWQGKGTLCCLEECDASVWTINVMSGEFDENDRSSYGIDPDNTEEIDAVHKWASKIELNLKGKEIPPTDKLGYIGRCYLDKGLGSRVCQIYSDSREWDTTKYPNEFFDTILVDGAHDTEIVVSDTKKVLPLAKRGGVVMWHDFCPPICNQFDCVSGVTRAIIELKDYFKTEMEKLFWIEPSWLLIGIKK